MAKLFLVEDHDVMRRTLITLLEREDDFSICGEADSAEAALEKLEASEADLLLVDISLPGQDGLGLVREVHLRWPALPCIILSGHDKSVYGIQAEVVGAVAYIDKRDVRAIVPTVRQALSSAR